MTVFHDPNTVATIWSQLRHAHVVMAYVGPDQIMPLTSILGALVGVALMFWNRLVGLFVKARTLFSRGAETADKTSGK